MGLAVGAGWLILAAVAIYYLGAAFIRLLARGIVLLPRAVVWVFVAVQQGVDWWTIAGQAGAALADLLVTPQVTIGLVALELVGALALYGLQRIFKDEERGTGSPEVRK